MAEFRLSPKAQNDLEDLFDYTIERWGEAQALHYIDLVAAACSELAAAPQQAQGCDHIRLGYRRRGVGQHMIYFRPTSDGIAVIRILHQRMDAAQHL